LILFLESSGQQTRLSSASIASDQPQASNAALICPWNSGTQSIIHGLNPSSSTGPTKHT